MADGEEKVKRKQPSVDTIRELFVKSGNECAFPGCTHRIINQAGEFIAQICHIEAAEEGGERFNRGMTNESRSLFPNLALMCYEHHVITNNVKEYPVERLKQMKASHEAKYTLAPETIFKSIVDEASHTVAAKPKSLGRLIEVMGWNYDNDMAAAASAEVAELVTRLRQVPKRTRQLLVSIVHRVTKSSGRRYLSVPFVEIVTACNLEGRDVYEQVQILDKYGIASYDRAASDYSEEIVLHSLPEGPWDIWGDIRQFCKETGHKLEEFIIDLRFDLLD